MEIIDVLLKKSQKYLQSAAVLFELEDYDSCASRVYFAMFYAAQAMLVSNGFSSSTNQGVRTNFINAFVETGMLPDHARRAFDMAATLHEISDYSRDFSVSAEDAELVLQEGEAFVNSIARLLPQPV